MRSRGSFQTRFANKKSKTGNSKNPRIPLQSSRSVPKVDARNIIKGRPLAKKLGSRVDARSLITKRSRGGLAGRKSGPGQSPISRMNNFKIQTARNPKVTIRNDNFLGSRTGGLITRAGPSGNNGSTRISISRTIQNNSPLKRPTSAPRQAGSVISCIQGFRVEVKGLRNTVVLDDVFELFSSVGRLKSCKMLRSGTAEVVFEKYGDAVEAVKRYHDRELDEWPMQVTILTKLDQDTAYRLSSDHSNPSTNQSGSYRDNIDMDVFYKALFNTSTRDGHRRPVDFNVNIN